ncbi:hypothetical protein GCK32_020205 [Trichostrongylus colubriformis]|uniref:Uncharacterized protein n=1 Tax=Trichostrongylus colubriformis TaxID=6319 RepID=A0AAN8IHI6_TRICO
MQYSSSPSFEKDADRGIWRKIFDDFHVENSRRLHILVELEVQDNLYQQVGKFQDDHSWLNRLHEALYQCLR